MRGATLDRPGTPAAAATARSVKPVMLLTVNVPFDRVAVDFAVETAVQTGAELYLLDYVRIARRWASNHTTATPAAGHANASRLSSIVVSRPATVATAYTAANSAVRPSEARTLIWLRSTPYSNFPVGREPQVLLNFRVSRTGRIRR